MVENALRFYIGGTWGAPAVLETRDVINLATEQSIGQVALVGTVDVNRAVVAAQAAFVSYSQITPAKRIALLERLESEYQKREHPFGELICQEIATPLKYACDVQSPLGRLHIRTAIEVLQEFAFETPRGSLLVVREPIGMVGMITPWNFPLNTVVSKVVAALAAGCCVILKPSELSPFSAIAFAGAVHAAGFPREVFNLVNCTGPVVGGALAMHPDIAMVSITGSTAAGIRVANCFRNSGQSCSAPTRMLVPRDQLVRVESLAIAAARAMLVRDPLDDKTVLGPVVSAAQYERVQQLITSGLEQGARLALAGWASRRVVRAVTLASRHCSPTCARRCESRRKKSLARCCYHAL